MAIRIASSRRRRATQYAETPYTPTAAIKIAQIVKAALSESTNRGRAMTSPTCSRIETAEMRAALEKDVMKTVDNLLGAIARPARVHFISGLPKTRSGKMLRRSIQALAEGRDPGDLTTIDDPSTLEQIRASLAS